MDQFLMTFYWVMVPTHELGHVIAAILTGVPIEGIDWLKCVYLGNNGNPIVSMFGVGLNFLIMILLAKLVHKHQTGNWKIVSIVILWFAFVLQLREMFFGSDGNFYNGGPLAVMFLWACWIYLATVAVRALTNRRNVWLIRNRSRQKQESKHINRGSIPQGPSSQRTPPLQKQRSLLEALSNGSQAAQAQR